MYSVWIPGQPPCAATALWSCPIVCPDLRLQSAPGSPVGVGAVAAASTGVWGSRAGGGACVSCARLTADRQHTSASVARTMLGPPGSLSGSQRRHKPVRLLTRRARASAGAALAPTGIDDLAGPVQAGDEPVHPLLLDDPVEAGPVVLHRGDVVHHDVHDAPGPAGLAHPVVDASGLPLHQHLGGDDGVLVLLLL